MSNLLEWVFSIDVPPRAHCIDLATLAEQRQGELLRNAGDGAATLAVYRFTIRPILCQHNSKDKRWRKRHSLSRVNRIHVQVRAPWPQVQLCGYAPRTRPVGSDQKNEADFELAFDLFGFKLGGRVKQELKRNNPRFDILTAWHESGALQWVFAERFVENQEEIVIDLLADISAEIGAAQRVVYVDAAFFDGNRIVQTTTNRTVRLRAK